MKLRVSEDTVTLIRGSHPVLKRRIREALRIIIEDPGSGKPLMDELGGLRSFRFGMFRSIYALLDKDIIEIVTIGPRTRVYEETYRIISREQ